MLSTARRGLMLDMVYMESALSKRIVSFVFSAAILYFLIIALKSLEFAGYFRKVMKEKV